MSVIHFRVNGLHFFIKCVDVVEPSNMIYYQLNRVIKIYFRMHFNIKLVMGAECVSNLKK